MVPLPSSYEEVMAQYRPENRSGNVFEPVAHKVAKWTHHDGGSSIYVKRIEKKDERARWDSCRAVRAELLSQGFLIPFTEFEHDDSLYHVMASSQTVEAIGVEMSDQHKFKERSQFYIDAVNFGLRFLCACVELGVIYTDMKPRNMTCSEQYGFRMIDLDSLYVIDDIALDDKIDVVSTFYGLWFTWYKYATLFDHAVFHMLFLFTEDYTGDSRDEFFKDVKCKSLFGGDAGPPVGPEGGEGMLRKTIICNDVETYDETHPFYKALQNHALKQTDFTELVAKIYKANMAQARAATEAIKRGDAPDPSKVRDICSLT